MKFITLIIFKSLVGSLDYIPIVAPQVSRTFSSQTPEALCPLNNNSPSSHQTLATATLLSVSMNLTPLNTSYKWNHAVSVSL